MPKLKITDPIERILIDHEGSFVVQGYSLGVSAGKVVTGQIYDSHDDPVGDNVVSLVATPNWAIRLTARDLSPDETYSLKVWLAEHNRIKGLENDLTVAVSSEGRGALVITSPSNGATVNCVFTAYGTKADGAPDPTGIMRPPTGSDITGVPYLSYGTSWAIQFSGLSAGVTYTLFVTHGSDSDDVIGLRANQMGP